MKNLISTSFLFAAILLLPVSSFADTTREMNIAVNDVFVPDIVARDTDARVVLSGMYPNSCYRWSRADVKTTDGTKHEIRALALVNVNAMCLMVLVPFSKEVNLGRLSVGEHTLRFVSGDDTYFERKLTVQ